jgi:glycosyltransferase involved in cell wall biosynthesis
VQLATLLEALVHDSRLELSVILLNDGRLACETKKLGIPVIVLSEQQHNSLSLFLKLIRVLKRQRPHVVHTHKYKDNILGAAAAAAVGICNVVRVVHGMTEPFSGMAYARMMGYESMDRLITRLKVKRLIAVSIDIATALARRYGVQRVVQIHNGINLEKIQVGQKRETMREALGMRPTDHVVGTVGRLTPVKGHTILLRAAASLIKKRGDIKVLIVGDGPLMQTLTKLVSDIGIEEEVVLAGQRDDVYDLVNCMDVFAMPSIHEGIPMVLLEALALRRPVVASRVGGIPEVVENGVSGLLVTPGNVTEVEQGIERILRDRSYAMQLGQAGRVRVEAEFSATVMAKRTAHLYASLVAQV